MWFFASCRHHVYPPLYKPFPIVLASSILLHKIGLLSIDKERPSFPSSRGKKMKSRPAILLFLLVIGTFSEVSRADFGEKSDVYNEEHIKQHMEDKIELGEEKKMSPEEERYHYFSMNDLNKDHVIDGIEVWKAVHHSHDTHGQLEEPPTTPVTDEEVEKSVDDIMKDIDLNGDGVIDYSEYIKKVEL